MRQAVNGTWILKAYEDSIDAGLTPKLLEYMLVHTNSITIDKNKLYFDNDTSELYTTQFDRLNNNIYLKKGVGGSKQIPDTLLCSIIDGDTLLSIYKDSMLLTFTKYNDDKCADETPYGHLINCKFIAGIYYTLADTARRHHIIFTKCGDIEGAQFIGLGFENVCNYSVSVAGFYTDPDAIALYNTQHNNRKADADFVHWQVVNDSLLLWHDRLGRTTPVVLVKAR